MIISKTTLNFAEKRNLEVFDNGDYVAITFDSENNDCADVEFEWNEEGHLVQSNLFNSNLANGCTGIIKTEKDFRKVIGFIADCR